MIRKVDYRERGTMSNGLVPRASDGARRRRIGAADPGAPARKDRAQERREILGPRHKRTISLDRGPICWLDVRFGSILLKNSLVETVKAH